MANHASALKRIRSNAYKRMLNRGQKLFCRSKIKKLYSSKPTLAEGIKSGSEIDSLLGKLAKKNIYHRNKAARLQSQIAKYIGKLA